MGAIKYMGTVKYKGTFKYMGTSKAKIFRNYLCTKQVPTFLYAVAALPPYPPPPPTPTGNRPMWVQYAPLFIYLSTTANQLI